MSVIAWLRGLFRPPISPVRLNNSSTIPDHTDILRKLRDSGWMVAIHNDYRLSGNDYTFYLFTHPFGVWIKGEGRTDLDALSMALASAETHPEFKSTHDAETTRLRNLLALAINKLCFNTPFESSITGEKIRDIAIKSRFFEFDDTQHTRMCAANHFDKRRMPTDLCTCGASKNPIYKGGVR